MADRATPKRFNKNMADEKKPVDEKVAEAGTQPDAKAEPSQVDLADELLKTQEELKKVSSERDNYRTGLKIAKGKASDEELEDDEQKFRRIAREEALAVKQSELSDKERDIIQNLVKENRELKTANRARAGITSTSAGGSTKDVTVSDNSPLSEEFKANLKARNWTPEMIKELEDKQRERQTGTRR